jgi:Mg-chelatase subunit ChlD
MDLTPLNEGGHDQIGIVGFNKEAWIEAPLATDIKVIHAAIDALEDRMAEFTRLDLALQAGTEALIDGPRLPGNAAVLILLTDGLPNQVPYDPEDGTAETTVLRRAEEAKAAGINVFTIAIGDPDDTNADLLKACATAPDHYYYTPDPDDLAQIYEAIAFTIDCPRSRFWGQH